MHSEEHFDVSVVIPVRNGVPLIGDQLEALARQDFDGRLEVVIADNGSTDGLADFAMQWRDRLDVRVVDASAIRGASYARNVAVRAARSDLILTCDADDVVRPGWIRGMVDALASHDIVGGRAEITRLNDPVAVAWRPRIDSFRQNAWRPFALGGCSGFHREVFDALNGYDVSVPYGGEDPDFSWRAVDLGFRLGPAPFAIIDCRIPASLRGSFRQGRVYARGGGPALYRKHRINGMPARPRDLLREIWFAATRWPLALVDVRRRGIWVRRLGRLVGRLEGCIRYRVIY